MKLPLGRIAGPAMLFAVFTGGLAQQPGVDPALLAKANRGDASAQVAVGEALEKSGGEKPNYVEAAAWYRKAADQNNAEAQFRLAGCYRDGFGVPRDMVEAANWYRKAAESGHVRAQATLALLYSIGQGVSANNVEAYYWFSLASEVKGPDQEKYAANRQSMAARLTADDLADAQERVTKWLAAHPRPNASE